ncbi:hypothetical protein V6Z12_D11G196500 [Gossypium hirsutum]
MQLYRLARGAIRCWNPTNFTYRLRTSTRPIDVHPCSNILVGSDMGSNPLHRRFIRLVDGYNLPMMISPQGGTGANCTSAGCAADLNGDCPMELKVVDGSEGVACKSACDVFGDPQYCCSGAYATPNTCKPSTYSQFFKTACPTAYSYAYDDGTSTFTCAGADYVITFCPSPSTSVKSSNPMAVDISSTGSQPTSSAFIGGAITTTLAVFWQLRHLF